MFVDEVFLAIHTGSYKAGYIPQANLPASSPRFSAPTGPAGAYGNLGIGRGSNEGFQQSRKRSYNEVQENGGRGDSHYARGDRQMKQMRRGGRGGRADGHGARGGRGGFQDPGYPFPHAGSPPLPSNFPSMPNMPTPSGLPFDPNDPMAAIIAMQAMGLPPLPGMPSLPQAGSPNGHSQFGVQSSQISGGQRKREPCRDYENRGYCARGDACPYEHGTDHIVAPGQDGEYRWVGDGVTRLTTPEYDPKNALLGTELTSPTSNGHSSSNAPRSNGHIRGQGRGRGDRGGFTPRKNHRADFSQAGPNHDRSITTIVVEQIPEDKFEEQTVRGFFSEFGNISEVTMQPYKRLALVKYDDYHAAKGAYDSPKVIFDNRFVKVYWYNPNTLPTPPVSGKANTHTAPKEEEKPFDKEEFERNAQVAQKKLEEKKAQMKEMGAKRQALEKQKEELAQKQAEEKRKLLEKLAAKGAVSEDVLMTDAKPSCTNGADDSKVSAHTRALREKVAELEAEAKSLGLDSALSDYTPRGRGRGRGRGSYRGWEGFAAPYRGSPRGRGGFRGRVAASGYNLDLRTKKVAVSGVEFNMQKDEALRQYLLVSLSNQSRSLISC